MTAKKRVVKRTPALDVYGTMTDYLQNRSMRERSAKMENHLKAKLMAWLSSNGDEAELEEPIDFASYAKGKLQWKKITGIKRVERKSQVLDEDKALAFLKKKDLLDECTETIVIVNEDALIGQNFEGNVTDKELASLYTDKTTYAFNLIDE